MSDASTVSNDGPSGDPSVVPTPKIDGEWTVDKALAAMSLSEPAGASASPLTFFHLMERLKLTKRQGWKRFGINQGESVADHSFRMAVMAMLAPPRLDLDKCVKMALVHDLAESLVGDITPADRVPRDEKNRREAAAMGRITGGMLALPGTAAAGPAGDGIRALWDEFEAAETEEARFVQDLDKVEMLLQMMEYERRAGGAKDLAEFTYVVGRLRVPETQEWARAVMEERERFWEGRQRAGGADDVALKLQDEYYGSK